MTGSAILFGDGVIDVHIANGVARLTLGVSTGGQPADSKPASSGVLAVPVVQLPVFARVFAEVTKQVEQRAKEAMAQAKPTPEAAPAAVDQVAGAFRFNG